MAHHKSAQRRVRNSKRKNHFHNQVKGQVRALEKSLRVLTAKKDKTKAEPVLKSLLAVLDKAENKAGYHKNKSARKKSQMIRLFNTLN